MNETEASKPISVIVIGRNEGQHLNACLMSVCGRGRRVVYVDSGSTDESVSIAQKAGFDVVELDPKRPFTAARARNEGVQYLNAVAPECDLVQFVDGDCLVEAGWLETAHKFLIENPNVTIVCGRLRERFPDSSVYNYLCNVEWDGPLGEIPACGGIFMMRIALFRKLDGFREGLRAGEEPELCLRVRQAGGRVWRIAADMALHDADMYGFGDWWRRSRRAGYAYAEVSVLHAKSSFKIWMREKRRALFWGALLPILILAGSLLYAHLLWLLLVYPLQLFRIAFRSRRNLKRPWLYAMSAVVGKFAEASGILRFYAHRLMSADGSINQV